MTADWFTGFAVRSDSLKLEAACLPASWPVREQAGKLEV